MDISVFDTAEQLAVAAAEQFVELAYEFHGELDRFSVVLAGGNTPRRVYELLATERFRERVEWPQVHLFFGDERAVAPDHPDSNYGMAYESLISKVSIPANNVHRIIGEGNAKENARSYENQLKTFFGGRSWPRFDLVFLGMGEDGHTASLFPGSEALQEKSNWVVAAKSNSEQERITLTLPVFNHAAHVIFLVTGKAKAQRLREVLESAGSGLSAVGSGEVLPARMIQPIDGTVEWLIDGAAASQL